MEPSTVFIAAGILAAGIPLSLYGLRVGMTPTFLDKDPGLELVIEKNVRVLAESVRRMEVTEQMIYRTWRSPRL